MRPGSADPFLRMESAQWRDIVGDGAVTFLRDRGVDQLSMGALARWMKVTPSAMAQRTRRPESVELIVEAVGRRWLQWSRQALEALGPPMLPGTAEERHGVRVWSLVAELALSEQAAGRCRPTEIVTEFRDHERRLQEEWWAAMGATGEFEAFLAALQGLRLSMATVSPGLPVAVGHRMVCAVAGIQVPSGPRSAEGVPATYMNVR